MLQRFRVVALLRTSHPERLFVQLDAFPIDVAEHHRAHAAVADRHGVVPLGRGLAVPELEIATRR